MGSFWGLGFGGLRFRGLGVWGLGEGFPERRLFRVYRAFRGSLNGSKKDSRSKGVLGYGTCRVEFIGLLRVSLKGFLIVVPGSARACKGYSREDYSGLMCFC